MKAKKNVVIEKRDINPGDTFMWKDVLRTVISVDWSHGGRGTVEIKGHKLSVTALQRMETVFNPE